MKHHLQLFLPILLLSGLMACGNSYGDDKQAASRPPGSATELFDGEMSKRGCELLTAKIVSATFDIPAAELRQMKIAGCRYDWDKEGQVLESGISMLRVYDDEASAANWFANATRSRTAEEMKQEMEKLAPRLDESKQLDTEQKKAMAKKMLTEFGGKAISFEDVDGVGDEARVSDEGTIYVRVGNLTFMVSAYKGPKAPPADLRGVDLKQMAKIAQEHAQKWTTETYLQRKSDATRLARAIVAEL